MNLLAEESFSAFTILLSMSTLTQAYRTTCIPQVNRLDALSIPNDYVGRQLEVIIIPMIEEGEESQYNAETLAAMEETLDILDGKIKVKSYATIEEMNADIDSEPDDA